MAVLLPTILPTVFESSNFVSVHTWYQDAIFFSSVSVTVSSVTIYAKNTSNLLVVVGGNNPLKLTTGQSLGAGSTISISGWHLFNFDQEIWKYRLTRKDPTEYSVIGNTLLPSKYFSLWKFRADLRPTTTITILVQTSAGNFTLTQTLLNNWDVGRNSMKFYVDKSIINQSNVTSITAVSSLTYLSGIGLVAQLKAYDGSDLTGFTNVGVTLDTSTGLKASPSFKAIGTTYAYTSAPVTSLLNTTIAFNVNLTSGGTQLANFYFGCNSVGSGNLLRLEARNANYSGFMTSSTWTVWNAPPTTGVTITPGIWHSVAININSSSLVTWYLDNIKQTSTTLKLAGNYIGIHGDGATVLGGNFDDLTIYSNITTG